MDGMPSPATAVQPVCDLGGAGGTVPAALLGLRHGGVIRRFMRDHDLSAWAEAIEVDRALRNGIRGIRGEVFLHRSCVPLEEADLSTASDRGQLDLWPNECEGMCGV